MNKFFTAICLLTVIAGFVGMARIQPDTAELLKQADSLYRQSQTAEAIEICNHIIKLDPKMVEAYLMRSNCHRYLGAYDKSLFDCGKAIELNPECARAYDQRAVVYRELADADVAKVRELCHVK